VIVNVVLLCDCECGIIMWLWMWYYYVIVNVVLLCCVRERNIHSENQCHLAWSVKN